MFSSIFGKKEENHSNSLFIDKVYIHSSGKINACIQLARQNPDTVFVAWFRATAVFFREYFVGQGLEASKVIEANSIQIAQVKNHPVVFVEHYPLHARETELVNDWGKTSIVVYSSMDEPLFKHFGSDKMIPLIKLLGMKESESIEHSYVTQSITKGQHKIADKIVVEQTAHSQAEWMEINLK